MVLTKKQRDAWTMYHERGMTQGEIARLMGISREAVNRLIARADFTLRQIELACAIAGGTCNIRQVFLS